MRDRLLVPALGGWLLAGACFPAPAAAQEAAPPGDAQREEDKEEAEIVVRAPPGDRTLIDRDSYVVRDTPLAQTRSAIDIMRDLPSVSVDPNGQLRLLGNRSVKILIDGREMPNAAEFLKTLQASRIARIEVMTNPSAQFSAYGSAGIINIILRRDFAGGVGGSATASAGNPGNVSVRLSPTWSGDEWTIAVSPSFSTTATISRRVTERIGPGAGPMLNRMEEQSGRGRSQQAAISSQLSFRPSETLRYDLTANASRTNAAQDASILISSPAGLFAAFPQASSGRVDFDGEDLSIERKAKGRIEGEEFKLALSWSHFAVASRTSYADILAAGPRAFAIAQIFGQSSSGAKADYTLPIGKTKTLSVGAELQGESEEVQDLAAGELPGGPVNSNDTFGGRWLDLSAYATLQTELGSFKILPGLRVQRRDFRFDEASGVAPFGETLFFPSLHVERRIGEVTARFSVARRADWPSIGQFSPYRRVTGPTTADIGNPQLRPEQTLSIEAGGQLSVSGQQLSATLYSRRRSDTRDTAVAITGDGQILAIPVNSGSRLSRGGQVSVRGRLSPDLRYSASAWAAQAAFDRLEGSAILRDSALEYGGNAQLEYSDGKAGKRGYDHLVLNIRYFGPTRYLQIAAEDFLTVEISHTHYLTDRLALVGTASNFFGDRIVVSERTAPAFVERSSSELHGPLFRISLTYDLGR